MNDGDDDGDDEGGECADGRWQSSSEFQLGCGSCSFLKLPR